MIVYGDILFLENFITGGVLLYLTAVIFRVDLHAWSRMIRLTAGAVLCGGFSFVIFLPVRTPWNILMEGAFAVMVCLVVFGCRRLAVRAAVFTLLTCFLGGVTMALLLAFGHTGMYAPGGIYTGDLKAGVLALFLGVSVFAARKIIAVVDRTKFYREHVFTVRIRIGDWEQEVRAFLDTGNGLRDPISGKSAAVASSTLWEHLERSGVISPERFRMIPYAAVGVSGLLPAIRTDVLEFAGGRCSGVFLAGAGEELEVFGGAFAGAKDEEPCVLLSRDMMKR